MRYEAWVAKVFHAVGEAARANLGPGVLCCGGNQGDRAVLDVGQERVLLGFVEAVDLVNDSTVR